MTGIASTTGSFVPSDEEIVFPAAGQSCFLIVDGPAAAQEALWETVRIAGPGAMRVAPPGPGFVSMAAISQACTALLPIVRREAPELLVADQLPADLFALDPYRVRQVGIGHLAEAVTFAVTRRISRESHQAALVIDRIARTLLEIRRRCPSFAAGLTLFCPDLHRWDRPSLRCLYRLVLLAEATDRVSVLATWAPRPGDEGLGDEAPGRDDPRSHIGPARRRFRTRLTADGLARTVSLPLGSSQPDTPPEPEADEAAPAGEWAGSYDELLLAMGNALVLQNYERVYHLAHPALERAADAEREAQARRLVGIAHAQLDDFTAAAAEFDRAIALTGNPPFAAHLHYLRGLIATKRQYDLDDAERHYARGLAALGDEHSDSTDSEPRGSVEQRVERAWLYNGQALIMTLRAKAAGAAGERERLTSTALALELEAFDLARGLPGAAPAYLRHNLMANIAFLLEITGRFDQAVSFWRRAFETYLLSDSREFRTSFDARLGQLLAKAGRPDEGARLLAEARELCAVTGDRFGEEELCLKLGYLHAVTGEHERAYQAYRDGLRIAHQLREADLCQDALAGLIWCLAELGAVADFAALRATVLRSVPATALAERLRAIPEPDGPDTDLAGLLTTAGVTRPMPSPKLRAYIPGVDLEGTPSRDLNRYLVWGTQRPEPLTT